MVAQVSIEITHSTSPLCKGPRDRGPHCSLVAGGNPGSWVGVVTLVAAGGRAMSIYFYFLFMAPHQEKWVAIV